MTDGRVKLLVPAARPFAIAIVESPTTVFRSTPPLQSIWYRLHLEGCHSPYSCCGEYCSKRERDTVVGLGCGFAGMLEYQQCLNTSKDC